MRPRYDLVVLGGGTAGLFAARTAAQIGARVALVERQRPGGECLYTGCVPSKSLIATAKLAHDMRTADRLGLEPAEPSFEFPDVMDRIDSVIGAAGKRDSVEYLTSHGVEVVQAPGRFAGPGVIEANGDELRWRAALIATGSRPAVPAIPGLGEAAPLTNESVFELRELPRRLAVLGGGPMGVELGQAFARLGSEVGLVEALPRLLPREEEDASRFLEDTLRSEGVSIHPGSPAVRVESAGDMSGTLIAGRDAAELEIPFDRLLVALGRCPAVDGLGLDTVGVELTDFGDVRVDRFLRTTGSHIYAAGDVVGGLYLTHVAAYQGLIAVAHALFRARREAEEAWIPWVTFTDPEIARVGATEAEARDSLGADPLVFRHDNAELDRALTAAAPGFSKLVADRQGRLLGATLVGPAAGESIAEVARLVREGRKVADLSQMVHAYPTFTEGPARAADEWWTHKYLNPRGRRWFRPLLRALRAIDRPR